MTREQQLDQPKAHDASVANDATPQAAQESYWREKGDGRFVLCIDGLERGVANTTENTGIILSMPGAPPYKFSLSDTELVFEAVEKRLGSPPVHEFRSKSGKTLIPWRRMAEQTAQHARSQKPPDKEATYRTQSAFDFSTRNASSTASTSRPGRRAPTSAGP